MNRIRPARTYLLAETLFESKQFGEAATEYERTAYFYPKNDNSAKAGYAALVAYKQQEDRLSGTARTEWHAKATDAGVKFAQAFPEHPESAWRAHARGRRDFCCEGSAARHSGVADLDPRRASRRWMRRSSASPGRSSAQSNFDLGSVRQGGACVPQGA